MTDCITFPADAVAENVKQVTLLLQTESAMRCVSQNLIDCRNKLYNKSTTNRSNGVRL